MSMPADIAAKFQTLIDTWLTGVAEIADNIFGPGDNEDKPFVQSNVFFAHCLFRTPQGYYLNTPSGNSLYWSIDVQLEDNGIKFGNLTYLGKDTNAWSDAAIAEMQAAVKEEYFYVTTDDTGELYVRLGSDGQFTLYSGGVYYNNKVHLHCDNPDSYYHATVTNGLSVRMGQCTYTIDAQGRCNTNLSYAQSHPSNSNNVLYSINTYPIVGNIKDTTNINSFIGAQGATNNYQTTYTTQGGYSFKVYYGDNYIITNAVGDNVTYNDVKNAIQTAVTQINDDNDTDITVPDYPVPPPPPTPIESDNQEDGGNYNHAEFTKVYACTSAELNDLYQWMGGGAAGSSGTSPVTVPDNFDPMNRIVGLIGYPMIIDVGVGDETTFTFRNAANQTINTGWSTYKYANFDRAFDFGTVDIPNWEELENGAPFLDYSATVEIYIPFCGIVGLDPQAVMGCTLSCKMWIDFVTGDCSAVVYTNYGGEDAQHPVAFVSGNCGSAEVVSANAFGSYQGAKAHASHKMSQAIIGGFKDLATSVIGGATTGFTRGAANPSGAGGSAGMRAGAIGSVIGGAMNLGVNLTLQNMDNRYAVQVAKNALGTTISGSFGQQTSWYYMDTPYIKVTWPTPISKDVELYGKTFGVPVHRSGTLSEFTGYTVCNNVDVSGIAGATASELAIIKQFLETGVFIKEGGEE